MLVHSISLLCGVSLFTIFRPPPSSLAGRDHIILLFLFLFLFLFLLLLLAYLLVLLASFLPSFPCCSSLASSASSGYRILTSRGEERACQGEGQSCLSIARVQKSFTPGSLDIAYRLVDKFKLTRTYTHTPLTTEKPKRHAPSTNKPTC